jgi:ParB family chromosome partitioning protein
MDPDDIWIVGLDTEDGEEHPLWDPRSMLPVDDNLVKNIIAYGVLEPITVIKDGEMAQVVYGRQRVKAAREANKQLRKKGFEPIKVPCQYKRVPDEGELMGMMISENSLRQSESPMDNARKLARYLSTGKTEQDAAITFGVTQTTIRNYLTLLDLDKGVQKLVEGGTMSASAAQPLAKLPRKEQMEEAKKLIESGKATTRGAKSAANKKRGKKDTSMPTKKQIRDVLGDDSIKLHDEFRRGLRWVLGETEL